MPDMTLDVVRKELAGVLGLDLERPEKNDPATVSDFNVMMERMQNKITSAGGDKTTPVGMQPDEFKMLADVIRESAADLKQARANGTDPHGLALADPNAKPKTVPEMADAARGGLDAWEQVTKRGVKTFSSFDIPTATIRDFISRPSTDPDVKRFHEVNDDLMMAAALMGHQRMATLADGSVDRVANVLPLKTWGSLKERLGSYVGRALNTSDESDWVPTEMSGSMIEKIYEATAVMQLFPRIDFPLGIGTMDIPTEGADVNIYLTGEATETDGDAKVTASKPGVGKVSLTPKVLATRMVVSQEMIEDAAIAIGPYMTMKMQRAFARDLDDIIINGDTTSTHHDTGYTVAANDRRRAWTGLIEKALTDTSANSDCSTWNFETFIKPTILMGEYADDAARVVCIMNRSTAMQLGYLVDTNKNPVFLTAQQWGSAPAPATSGVQAIGSVYGYRVITSAKVSRSQNASGIYDGSTTTKSSAIWVHLDSWLAAVKRDMRLVGVERPEQLQRVLVGSWRGIVKPVPATSTDLCTALSYDIPNGS